MLELKYRKTNAYFKIFQNLCEYVTLNENVHFSRYLFVFAILPALITASFCASPAIIPITEAKKTQNPAEEQHAPGGGAGPGFSGPLHLGDNDGGDAAVSTDTLRAWGDLRAQEKRAISSKPFPRCLIWLLCLRDKTGRE